MKSLPLLFLGIFFMLAFSFTGIVLTSHVQFGALEQSTETLERANLEALPIEKLNRKPTYEMIMLFVDENRKTFTVWVKKEWENGRIQQIGNLEDSQKQGIWIMVLQ